MNNQFRTLLMNIDCIDNLKDYIAPGFIGCTLTTPLDNFRLFLYPSEDRSDILKRTSAYTELLIGCGLSEVFTLQDPRITYTLTDISYFGEDPIDLNILTESIYSPAVIALLTYGTNNEKYIDLYHNGTTSLQKLAGLIANYSYKLSPCPILD